MKNIARQTLFTEKKKEKFKMDLKTNKVNTHRQRDKRTDWSNKQVEKKKEK